MKIAFFHPDLGIGGAERLIVDSVVALSNNQNDVVIFTNYYNPRRCFEDASTFHTYCLSFIELVFLVRQLGYSCFQ